MPLSRAYPGVAPWLRQVRAGWARVVSGSPAEWAARALQGPKKLWPTAHVPRQPPPDAAPATNADVVACYRLLLGRAPDPEGVAHYLDRRRQGMTRAQLVEEFLSSVEFSRRRGQGQRSGPGAGEIVTTAEGFRIHVDPSDFAVGHTLARTAVYEPEVTRELRQRLSRGQTFVDVGANIGWFSLLAASVVGPTGTVVAVEPNPWNVALLRQSAKENGFDNIEILNIAAAATSGAAALETDGSNGRLVPIDGPPLEAFEANFVVPVEPLDAALSAAGVSRVDLMKIDVEGAEPLVLEGAASTIAAHQPTLVTEFFPLALDTSPWGSASGYLATLRRLGYLLFVIGAPGAPVGGHDDDLIMSLSGTDGHVDLLALPA